MELANYQSYEQYKQELDGELQKTAEGFVRIGYLLKVARDTNILAESGYKSVAEFAQAEYNLDKTQVSRFISINDRFSAGGYSDTLLPEYQGYGYAKLTIMLQIPAEIAQELTPDYSKAEIQAVKEELDEEKKISDLEVIMEGQKDEEEGLLYRVIKQLGHDDPELYEKIWNVKVPFLTWDEIGDIMAPFGDRVYSVRIQGVGRVMMTMQDGNDEIMMTNTRSFEKESVTRQDVANKWIRILKDAETAGDAWEKMYSEPWPKGKVAPVQQPEPEKKPEPKKESRVSKAKVEKKPQKSEPQKAAAEEETQLPGQMNVEDFPEYMPEPKGEDHGTDAGMDAGDGESGMSDGTGGEPDAGRSRDDEGMDDKKADDGNGEKEDEGDSEDPRAIAMKRIEESYRVLTESLYLPMIELSMQLARKLHDAAINMAAELERFMMLKKEDHEE